MVKLMLRDPFKITFYFAENINKTFRMKKMHNNTLSNKR